MRAELPGLDRPVGIITGDTPKNFEEFARGRDLDGATIVLDSNGGSVNDAITQARPDRNPDKMRLHGR